MKCPNCETIVPNDSQYCHICGSRIAVQTTYTATVTTEEPRNSKGALIALIAVCVMFVVFIGSIVFVLTDGFGLDIDFGNSKAPGSISREYSTPREYSTSFEYSTPREYSAEQKAAPQSGEVLYGSECRFASKITVSAAPLSSCVVKLKDSSGNDVLSFYVGAGETVSIGVPEAYLYVYFAEGKYWYGEEHLFGEDTVYFMDDEIVNFSKYTWEYDLGKSYGGNFTPETIDADDFS